MRVQRTLGPRGDLLVEALGQVADRAAGEASAAPGDVLSPGVSVIFLTLRVETPCTTMSRRLSTKALGDASSPSLRW
jgi:hypothetical protein